jgi:predicted acyl esterase
MQINAARLVAEAALDRLDRLNADGADATDEDLARFHADAAYVWDNCATAIATLFKASGASGIAKKQPLQLVDNGWEKTPRVRYAVHDMRGGDQEDLPADSFPPEGGTNTKFFLHGGPRILAPIAPVPEIPAEYDSESNPALCSFTVRFDQETVLAGYPKAHLWVEAKGSDDMDLFLLVQKLDAQGSHLSHITVPNSGARMQDITEQGSSVFRYKGSLGRLRVSARHLDPAL